MFLCVDHDVLYARFSSKKMWRTISVSVHQSSRSLEVSSHQVRRKSTAWTDEFSGIAGGSDFDGLAVLGTIGLFSASYSCHYNAPKLYLELKDPSPRKFFWIVGNIFAGNLGWICVGVKFGLSWA